MARACKGRKSPTVNATVTGQAIDATSTVRAKSLVHASTMAFVCQLFKILMSARAEELSLDPSKNQKLYRIAQYYIN